LSLHILGVDVVIGNGPPVVIDVNDWPSFSPCCDEAASVIARLVVVRAGGQQC
jgi:glutathione synthase/RimK-type ligase-like ATP-grasp enzyme